MTRTSTARSERFNIRLDPEARKRIEQAASLEGKTASSFILSSALSQAERTIRRVSLDEEKEERWRATR